MSLRSQFEGWLIVKGVSQAFERLESQHVGHLLDAWLDHQYGPGRSEEMQQRLVAWLRAIIQELEADVTKRVPPASDTASRL